MPDHVTDDSLYAEEYRLEREALDKGIARYRRISESASRRGDGAGVKAVEHILLHWFGPLRNLIAAEKKAISMGKAGKNRRERAAVIGKMNTARMALVTLHEAMGMMLAEPEGVTPVRMALAISRGLNATCNFRELRSQYNEGKRAWLADGNSRRTYRNAAWNTHYRFSKKRQSATATNRVAAMFLQDARWRVSLQMKVGAFLLGALDRVATTAPYGETFVPAFTKRKVFAGKHFKWLWRLSDECRWRIQDGHDHREVLRPRFLPMIVPPLPWKADARGGYLTLPTTLVKTRGEDRSGMDSDFLREAVNAIGSTPWRVNRFVLDVARELSAGAGDVAGLPRLVPLEFPPKPPDFSVPDSPGRLDWKRRAAGIITRNFAVASVAAQHRIKMDIAVRMAAFERLYFPHNADFRGRLYPIPELFQHQGDDVSRGLLEFAEPKDCSGERARFWLKVHLANRCGQDKVAFAERVAWVDSQIDIFAGWVEQPLENTGWMEADSPFQALAAARALIDPSAGAHIPVQIDGSNNALQHYAAMLRCPAAGAMVNLLPMPTPADFYQAVAGRVAAQVGRDADAGNRLAKILDSYVTRKIVKQTAMTNYYGVTMVGARRQTHENLIEAGFLEKEVYPASRYLSRIVLDATERTCPSVQGELKWLRSCARRIASRNLPVRWTTPMGLCCEQAYRNGRSIRVLCPPVGVLRYRQMDETCPVATYQQVNGFPNFVHSIDASHLMCAAVAAHDRGIRFAGVHDSVWTHASEMDRLREIVAEQFLLVHERPLLDVLAAELAERYPGVVFDPPPPLGKLDLSQVERSEYLFA